MANEVRLNELTPSFFKNVFLMADKDDDCKITLKQLGKKCYRDCAQGRAI